MAHLKERIIIIRNYLWKRNRQTLKKTFKYAHRGKGNHGQTKEIRNMIYEDNENIKDIEIINKGVQEHTWDRRKNQ